MIQDGYLNLTHPLEGRTMKALIKNFRNEESGAVTVDWVVLTAAIVGLGIAVLASVSGGVSDLATDVTGTMTGYTIATEF